MSQSISFSFAAAAAAMCCGAAAQESSSVKWRHQPVVGAQDAAWTAVWPITSTGTALAQRAAAAWLRQCMGTMSGLARVEQVEGGLAISWQSHTSGRQNRGSQRSGAPVHGGPQVLAALAQRLQAPAVSDDDGRAAWAAAGLSADDEMAVYPGPVLRGNAVAALFPGRRQQSAAAPWFERDSAELLAALRAELAALGGPHDLVTAGAGDPAHWRSSVDALPPPRPPVVEASAAAERAQGAHPEEARVVTHRLVDLPYVAVPLLAPPVRERTAYLEFAVVAEVLRLRAWQVFGKDQRSGEVAVTQAARLPLVHFEPDRGDGALFLGRRGWLVRLGVARSAPVPWADVAAQLSTFCTEAHQRPPSLEEWEDARRALLGRLAPRPPEADRFGRSPPASVLGVWTRATALRAHRGWDDDLLRDVEASALAKRWDLVLSTPGEPWVLVTDRPEPLR